MKITPHNTGFSWGPVRVIRLCDDEKHGVWLLLCSDKHQIEVRVTKSGLFRIGKVGKSVKDGLFIPKHED